MQPGNSPQRLGRWFLHIHLYGGLICCWYLFAYGLTSLNFNHPGFLPEGRSEMITWERSLAIPDIADNLKLGEAVSRELDLIGWVIPWNMQRDPKGDLRFELSRPGKKYLIESDRRAGRVRVREQRTGLSSALHFLHGSNEGVPGSRFLSLWGVYTEITTWLVLFFVGSGIYLWARREPDRRVAFIVLAGSVIVSAALMSFLYFVG